MSRHRKPEDDIRAQVEEYRSGQSPAERVYPDLTNDTANDLRIIRDMGELQHTCYIEVCSEATKVRACWNKGAMYFTLEGFAYLEPMIRDVYPYYSQYSFQCLERDEWLRIIEKMKDVSHALKTATHKDDLGLYAQNFFFHGRVNPFDVAFDFMRDRLKVFIDEFVDAIEADLAENDKIYILGL